MTRADRDDCMSNRPEPVQRCDLRALESASPVSCFRRVRLCARPTQHVGEHLPRKASQRTLSDANCPSLMGRRREPCFKARIDSHLPFRVDSSL
jgi:hypothetical protein